MIYLINIVFVFIISIFYELNKKSRIFLILLIFFISLLPALRSIDVGTDTYNYVKMFEQFGSSSFFELFNYPTEKGYILLNYFSSFFVESFNEFFLIFYLLVFFNFIYFFSKNSNFFPLSVLVFLILGLYSASFNIMRQIMALSICLLSLKYVFNRDFIKFSLIVFLSSLFHITALIFMMVYFVYKYQEKFRYILLFIVILIWFIFKFYLEYVLDFINMSVGYAEFGENSGGGPTLIFYIIMLSYFYYLGTKSNDKKYHFYLNLFTICVSLVFLFFIFKVPLAGPMRLILYFSWTLCMLFPLSLNCYKGKLNKNLILFLYCIALLLYCGQAIYFNVTDIYEFGVKI